VHVDGHIDFFHPGNFDTASRLGSVAGMDLALATGRGEPLLTAWPDVGTPLVPDADAFQVGDRETESEEPATGTLERSIALFTVQEILRRGLAEVSDRVAERLDRRGLDRVCLHVDLDVLDQRVMPTVDSPGQPGAGLRPARGSCLAPRRHRPRDRPRRDDLRPGARSGREIPAEHRGVPRERAWGASPFIG
jgi:arginase